MVDAVFDVSGAAPAAGAAVDALAVAPGRGGADDWLARADALIAW